MAMLNYSLKTQDGSPILELSGSLTSKTAEIFRNVVERLIERSSLIVNMENLTFVSSSGVKVLVDVSFFAKDKGKRVILLWATKEFLRLAESMESYNYFIFCNSIEEGAAKIKYFT